jgi:hypothetical protein
MSITRRPQSALPLSPLTKAEIRTRLDGAEFRCAFRSADTARRLDDSQRHATPYDTAWILEAGRDWAVLDAAMIARSVA